MQNETTELKRSQKLYLIEAKVHFDQQYFERKRDSKKVAIFSVSVSSGNRIVAFSLRSHQITLVNCKCVVKYSHNWMPTLKCNSFLRRSGFFKIITQYFGEGTPHNAFIFYGLSHFYKNWKYWNCSVRNLIKLLSFGEPSSALKFFF